MQVQHYFLSVSGASLYGSALRIALTELPIKHTQATYFLRASSPSLVAIVDGDFTVKQLYQRAGQIKLKAGQTIDVWGAVTGSVKQLFT